MSTTTADTTTDASTLMSTEDTTDASSTEDSSTYDESTYASDEYTRDDNHRGDASLWLRKQAAAGLGYLQERILPTPPKGHVFYNLKPKKKAVERFRFRDPDHHAYRNMHGDVVRDPTVGLVRVHDELILAAENRYYRDSLCHKVTCTALTCGIWCCLHTKTIDSVLLSDRRVIWHSREERGGKIRASEQTTYFLDDVAYYEQHYDRRKHGCRKWFGCCFCACLCPFKADNVIQLNFHTYPEQTGRLAHITPAALPGHVDNQIIVELDVPDDMGPQTQANFLKRLMEAQPVKSVVRAPPQPSHFSRQPDPRQLPAEVVHIDPTVFGFGDDETIVDAIPANVITPVSNLTAGLFFAIVILAVLLIPSVPVQVIIAVLALIIVIAYKTRMHVRSRRSDVLILTDRRLTSAQFNTACCGAEANSFSWGYTMRHWMIPQISYGEITAKRTECDCKGGGRSMYEFYMEVNRKDHGNNVNMGAIEVHPTAELEEERARTFMRSLLSYDIHPVLPHRPRDNLPPMHDILLLPNEHVISSLQVVDRALPLWIKFLIVLTVGVVGAISLGVNLSEPGVTGILLGLFEIILITIFAYRPLWKRGTVVITSHRLVTYEHLSRPWENYFKSLDNIVEIGSTQRFWMLHDILSMSVEHIAPRCLGLRKEHYELHVNLRHHKRPVRFELSGLHDVIERANDFASLLYVSQSTKGLWHV